MKLCGPGSGPRSGPPGGPGGGCAGSPGGMSGQCPRSGGAAKSLSTAPARSAGLKGCSIRVVSATRRAHSRTLHCCTKRSCAWARRESAATSARTTAQTVAASSRPKSDCGQSGRRIVGRAGASVGRHRDADHVALAVYGLDDLRRARVVAEDLPQAADAHVDAAIEGIGVAAAQQLRQLGTAQHAVAGREQYREQSVLGAAERDLPAGGLFQGAGDRVEPPAAEGEAADALGARISGRSEEHTSELQSLAYLVCRLL